MLASFPASMVNQKSTDLGIPNRFKLKSSRFRDTPSASVLLGLGLVQSRGALTSGLRSAIQRSPVIPRPYGHPDGAGAPELPTFASNPDLRTLLQRQQNQRGLSPLPNP
jgi:hypothetical protein